MVVAQPDYGTDKKAKHIWKNIVAGNPILKYYHSAIVLCLWTTPLPFGKDVRQ